MKKIKRNESFSLYLGIAFFFLMDILYYLKPLTTFEISMLINLREHLMPFHAVFLGFAKYFNLFVLTIIIISLLLWAKKQTIVYWLLGNIVIVGICFNYFLKNILQRERPTIFSQLIPAYSFNFPSGSVLVSTLLFGGLCLTSSQLIRRKSLRFLFCLLMGTLILLVSLSRMYVGIYYPTDVLAAICLGFSSLLISKYLMERRTF